MIDNDKLSKLRSMYAIKANDLITKSRFSLTLEQQKILLYMISKVTPLDSPSDWFEIEVQDYCEICGLARNGYYYNNIKKSLKGLADKSCWIKDRNGKIKIFRWLDEVEIIEKGGGTIRYTFHKNVALFLFELKEKFTKIELIQTLTFRSQYTIRLYEYLKVHSFRAYKDGGYAPYELEVKLEDLMSALDLVRDCEHCEKEKDCDARKHGEKCEKEKYERLQDFRRRVLEVAENEINNKTTDMRIEISYGKDGRRTDRVIFKYLPIWQPDEASASSQRRRILNGEENRNTRGTNS